jgi:hypothetical protein
MVGESRWGKLAPSNCKREERERRRVRWGNLHRVREDMSEHYLEVAEVSVRVELPLEELSNIGAIAEDVGEWCGAGGVCLRPGVGADGACV